MAEAKSSSVSYLPGEDPETIEANRRYQEALATLTKSLDSRKNRFFDPVLLAMAEGFLSPTQTGSSWESLGKVAGKVGQAEAAAAKEEQEIAQQKLAVAGQGVELQRLKARDAALAEFLGEGPSRTAEKPASGPLTGPQAKPIVGPQARLPDAANLEIPSGEAIATPLPPSGDVTGKPIPVGPLSRPAPSSGIMAAGATPPPREDNGALTQVRNIAPQSVTGAPPSFSDKPPGFEGIDGIRVGDPNPNFITGKDYIRLNRFDSKKSLGDLLKEAQEIEQKRYRNTEGGVLDLAKNIYYQYPTGKTEKISIHGYPGTYDVDARTAARLSLYAANNDPKYWDLAERVIKGPDRPGAKPEGKGEGEGKPSTRIQSVEERAVEQKEAEARASELGKKAAEKEAAVSEKDATARRVYGSATRVLDYLKQSPNYYGIFARPGVVSAVSNLIKEGIQTPSGTIKMAGFEDSMRALMPGVTQKDLDNVTKAGAELAEIELEYTRLYLDKQGAITEGERKIVRAIPGTVSSSPEVLRTRMELLKARSQYDIDVNDAFRQWQDKNPGRSYFEFERKSDLYKQIKKDFEEETEKIFGGIKAVPTRERRAGTSRQAASGAPAPSSGFVRDPETGVIRRKKPGE